MNSPEDPQDRLIDALLKEQSRRSGDAAFVAEIRRRLDVAPRRRARRRWRWLLPATAAAAVIMAAGLALTEFGGLAGVRSADHARAEAPVSHRLPHLPAAALPVDRERYGRLTDPPWQSPLRDPLSTFSIDVDTASYTNVRRLITEGGRIPRDAVRIEEFINFFDYGYEPPRDGSPFAVGTAIASCPWNPKHLLARISLKGREVAVVDRPPSNLVFLVDVSGSMAASQGMLRDALNLALDQLDGRDRLAIVAYAQGEGVVLDPVRLDPAGKARAREALGRLEAGGPTNGGAGIRRAYELAAAQRVSGGVNRVVLATDGDFNLGVTGDGELVDLVKEGAAMGVDLTVLGFGTGNLNDAMMEEITNEGNGSYHYIDSSVEARRVLLQKLTGTLMTIAADVKIQTEFNPARIGAYRLIGYANRLLRNEDFNNDKVDAGEIGAGHTVTCFYEIIPHGVELPDLGDIDPLKYDRPAAAERSTASADWFTVKLRYKLPEESVSRLTEVVADAEPQPWSRADGDFRFASAVALFGMKLRQMPEVAGRSWQDIVAMAKSAASDEARRGFIDLVAMHGGFEAGDVQESKPEPQDAARPARLVRVKAMPFPISMDLAGFTVEDPAAPAGVNRQVVDLSSVRVAALPMTLHGDRLEIRRDGVVVSVVVPAAAEEVTLAVFAAAGPDGRPDVKAQAIDSSVATFPVGSLYLVNLTGEELLVEAGDLRERLPAAGRILIPAPADGADIVHLQASRLVNHEWRRFLATAMRVMKASRATAAFFPDGASGEIALQTHEENLKPPGGLRFLRAESTLWYVQFGLESQGKWAPRLTGLTSDKKRLQSRVSAVEMLAPGDVFFADGAMAGRFKFQRIEERELTSERTGLKQAVKFAIYEDLWTGAIRESQAGLPDAELAREAYRDRTAVLRHKGLEFTVFEGVEFTLPGEEESGKYLLLKVADDQATVEFTGPDGRKSIQVIAE
jgi:Ca-activated chloride channel family protein